MQKTALFIGRFQTPHFGHIDAINQIIENGYTKIILGVGSANKEFTSDNPFTFQEREKMIKLLLNNQGWRENVTFDIYPIPDTGDNTAWRDYILRFIPKFDIIATGNERVKSIFEQHGIGNVDLEIRKNIKASHIRRQILMWKDTMLVNNIGKDIMGYLLGINAPGRMQKIYKNEFLSPQIAVDGLILTKEKQLILIKRKSFPYGYALPGGMVDYGESPEHALIREMKEELGVDVKISKLIGVYGEPERDPRAHVISVAYCTNISGGKLEAGDDAKELLLIDLDKTDKVELAFDHKNIIKDFKNTISK